MRREIPAHAIKVSIVQRRPQEEHIALPPPLYRDWSDFLSQTSPTFRREWCKDKAKKANKDRLMSGAPDKRIKTADVLQILFASEGKCCHCGSLAVEKRPSVAGSWLPRPWSHIGRRIGSLEHLVQRDSGGSNAVENLAWACLWCNTWRQERLRGARDHGGHYPEPVSTVNVQQAVPADVSAKK